MSEVIANELSQEDHQLIETYQMGKPLAVFWLKPSYLRFFRRVGMAFLICGSIVLVVVFAFAFHEASSAGSLWNALLSSYQIPPLLGGIYSLLRALICFYFKIPLAQSTHLVLCKQGLLQIDRRHVDAVDWKDVLSVQQEWIGRSYFIRSRDGKVFRLSAEYQDFEEVMTFIAQFSEVEA